MWLKVAGFQALVLWQLSQAAVVGIWPADLPVAVLPLWQVEQAPGATPVWLKLAGVQALVLWQPSHTAVVGICELGLPVAVLPLWQLAQLPAATAL